VVLVVATVAAAAAIAFVLVSRTGADAPDASAASSPPASSTPAPSTITDPARPGGPTPVPTSPPARPAGAFPMTVRYVYDGDTLQLQHATSNAVVTTTNPIRVRIVGVDTPEAKPSAQCWSAEATRALRGLAPVGSTVWVLPERDSWDDYGRRLFDVWTADGRFVAGALVDAGDGRALRIWPNVDHAPYLAGAEMTARTAGRGLWGHC
jgi:endonuclease YncB( thermonuclease family)